MIGAPAATERQLMTGEDLAQLPDADLFELIDGRLTPMTPTGQEHGEVEFSIGAELRAFVRAHKLGRVSGGEVGIYVRRDPDTIRAADVLFISNERYARKQSASFLDVAPELIVEVLSPTESWSEVTQKMKEYFAIGVRVIWIVDLAVRTVYAYRSLSDVREFTAQDELIEEQVLPGFAVKVAALFEN
ncbi:MAG: Uma2 family endonuclease [Chloroflexi bacterium]|nr:Uma2 family endonuclease [Chloroflexota bacterium]